MQGSDLKWVSIRGAQSWKAGKGTTIKPTWAKPNINPKPLSNNAEDITFMLGLYFTSDVLGNTLSRMNCRHFSNYLVGHHHFGQHHFDISTLVSTNVSITTLVRINSVSTIWSLYFGHHQLVNITLAISGFTRIVKNHHFVNILLVTTVSITTWSLQVWQLSLGHHHHCLYITLLTITILTSTTLVINNFPRSLEIIISAIYFSHHHLFITTNLSPLCLSPIGQFKL